MRLKLMVCATAILLVVWLMPWPVQGAKNACPLTVRQEAKATNAFKKLAPVFQEPRCLNCHGAVNPFSRDGGHGGGYIDIREETKKFLQLPDFQNSLTVGADPDGTRTARDIARLKEIAESPSEITDNDFIRQKAFDPMRKACKECHISSWIIPMRHNHFVGRSAKEMCVHIKTSSLTNQPDLFLRHMQDDELVLEGFKGRRGLLEPVGPEPPTMSFATLEKYANEWIDAMGEKFHRPPDCGCVVHGDYVLEFQSSIVSSDPYGDPAQSRASAVIRLEASEAASADSEINYIGQGMIAYQTGPMPNWEPCTALVRGQGTVPMRVFQAFIHIEEPSSESVISQKGSATIELLYGLLGGSQETTTGMPADINYKCVPNKPKPYSFWSSHYISGRAEDSTDPMKMFLLKDWTYVGQNGVVATKTLRSTCGGMCDQEVAIFTLREGDGSETSSSK
ncbi:MAG: hypothetical protein KF693_07290 [Nitrospira sp.]|nr:hypothetical protein [Nitrospira sp.]